MNYYEILEVNENASLETINKVYRIQAKRYHPDLQENEVQRKKAEEKMKQINDAYNVLSDNNKRKEYDEKLRNQRELEKQQEKIDLINEIQNRNNNLNIQNNINDYNEKRTIKNPITEYEKEENIDKTKNVSVKEKIITNIKATIILVIIIIFIYYFPPTHKILVKLYEENYIMKYIVEGFKNLISSFKNV